MLIISVTNLGSASNHWDNFCTNALFFPHYIKATASIWAGKDRCSFAQGAANISEIRPIFFLGICVTIFAIKEGYKKMTQSNQVMIYFCCIPCITQCILTEIPCKLVQEIFFLSVFKSLLSVTETHHSY